MTNNDKQAAETSVSSPQPPVIAVYTRQAYPSASVIDYLPYYTNTDVNTLIIAGPNGSDGGIVYNNAPYVMFNRDGNYVGDWAWPCSLTKLANDTNIDPSRIFLSLSNSAISTLAAMPTENCGKVMTWLKTNGIAGIDMDCENWGTDGLSPIDPAVQAVTLAVINAGLLLTAAPYTDQTDWQSWCTFVSNNKGAISWFNVQCYAGGSTNDPVADWAIQFSNVPIVAGFEASGTNTGAPTPSGVLTPSGAQSQLAKWQAESPKNSLAGAFIWNFGILISGSYHVEQYVLAMYAGLAGNPDRK